MTIMSITEKGVRQSVTLPARVARRVKSWRRPAAEHKWHHRRAHRIGNRSPAAGKETLHELADRLARSRDVEEQTRLKEELAVMTFGE